MPEQPPVISIPAEKNAEPEAQLSTAASEKAPVSLSAVMFAVWGVAALLLLMRRVTQYQSFTRYLRAGSAPIEDPALLDRYAEVCMLAGGAARPPELRVSALVSTPMLAGIWRPYIVLPQYFAGDSGLEKVLLHELLHHKQRDVLYKWFAQAVLCLHWFNPAVWIAVRTLEQDCELACDESALRLMRPEEHRSYGDALLQVVRTDEGYHSEVASLALSENAKQLKERLGMIMNFRKRTRIEKVLAVCLTLALCAGSVAVGAYAAGTPRAPAPIPAKQGTASSAPQKQEPAVIADASTPEGTLELAMQAVKALDSDALCRYSNNQKIAFSALYYDGRTTMFGNGNSSGQKGPALLGGKQDTYPEIVRSLSWKIGKSSVSGDTAKISLQITNRDFGGVMAEMISSALMEAADGINTFDEDENFKLFQAVPDNKTVALVISSKMQKKNGNWELQIDDAFANAVFGNLFVGHDSPESKAKIDAAEKIFEEYIRKSVHEAMKDVNIQMEIDEAMKDIDFEKQIRDAEKEIRDAMKDVNFEKELRDAMKDAFR